jgi:hypothetical protein
MRRRMCRSKNSRQSGAWGAVFLHLLHDSKLQKNEKEEDRVNVSFLLFPLHKKQGRQTSGCVPVTMAFLEVWIGRRDGPDCLQGPQKHGSRRSMFGVCLFYPEKAYLYLETVKKGNMRVEGRRAHS